MLQLESSNGPFRRRSKLHLAKSQTASSPWEIWRGPRKKITIVIQQIDLQLRANPSKSLVMNNAIESPMASSHTAVDPLPLPTASMETAFVSRHRLQR